MASIFMGEAIFENGPGRVKRKLANGGNGVGVIVGVLVIVAVRVGEGPRVGVKIFVGQGVNVAPVVGVGLISLSSGEDVSLASTIIPSGVSWAVLSGVVVAIAAVGLDEGVILLIGGAVWQAASVIMPAIIPKTDKRMATLNLDLSICKRG
jgi:hypothetical protein